MSDRARLPRMTADEFIAWAMERPDGERYELVAGEVVATAPERVAHARSKFRIARRLANAVEEAGLPCEVFADGLSVQVDETTLYEPDAMLRCGDPLPGSATRVMDPLIIVEVRSRSTAALDAGEKLAGYMRIPTLRHYLIVAIERRAVIHHARTEDGAIATRIVRDFPLRLDPPGIDLADPFA